MPWYTRPEWWLCLLAALTLLVIAIQTNATLTAARAAQASVKEAQETAKRQLRAYLSVGIGPGISQDRNLRLRYEGKPVVFNSGDTPAHKVRLWTKAAVLPTPAPLEGEFVSGEPTGEGTIGAKQSAFLSGVVDVLVDDSEVEKIERGQKALYVWGLVQYEDTFGSKHSTRFCHQYLGPPNDKSQCIYVAGHNSSD